MKSDGTEMIRVGAEMSCVSAEIDFVDTEMNSDGGVIDFVSEEMTGDFPEIAPSF